MTRAGMPRKHREAGSERRTSARAVGHDSHVLRAALLWAGVIVSGRAANAAPCSTSADAQTDVACARAVEQVERMRNDPRFARSVEAAEAWARDAETLPEGTVRNDARAMAAESLASTSPASAQKVLERIVTDQTADDAQRAYAASRWVEIAANDMSALGRATHVLPPGPARSRAARLLRRHRMARLAPAVAAAPLVFAAFAMLRAPSGRRRQLIAGPARRGVAAGLLVVVGGLLTLAFESGHSLPFVVFGVGLTVIVFAASIWGGLGRSTQAPRAMRAALCALAVVNLGFWVLYQVDARYLENFGL